MIKIYKSTADDSKFRINRDDGNVEETKLIGISPAAEFELEPIDCELSYDQDTSLRDTVFLVDEEGYLAVIDDIRAIGGDLRYDGSFMDVAKITITVKSNQKIDFNKGDFIIWDYDNIKYYFDSIISETKQASAGSFGEAFVYELSFISELSNISRCDFLDVVINDNNIHFTALPNFSFYGDAFALADRINANLRRLFNNYEVQIDTSNNEILEALLEYKNIDVSNINCFDAIKQFYELWGVGFIYYYDESIDKHIVKVGAIGGQTGNFSYGQGNGLRLIIKNLDTSNIVTRLRAYGSDNNMPSRYYNKLTDSMGQPIINEMQYIPNLMIPIDKWGTTLGRPDVLKAYIDSNSIDVDPLDTTFETYGIREKSVYFDGSGDNKDIKPTIEGITAGELRQAISNYTGDEVYFSPSLSYSDSNRMDLIKNDDSTQDDGMVLSKIYYDAQVSFSDVYETKNTIAKFFTIDLASSSAAVLEKEGKYAVNFRGTKFTISSEDTTISWATAKVFLIRNGQPTSLVSTIQSQTSLTSPAGETITFENFTFNAPEGGDVYGLQIIIEVTLSDIDYRESHIDYGESPEYTYTLNATNVDFIYEKSIPENIFEVEIKQIGFDIKKFVSESGKEPIIAMNTGNCAGRKFKIVGTEYLTSTDSWLLKCVRQVDESIGQSFPNNIFKIRAGDQFILSDMSMPYIYVNIAAIRLYQEACNWLRKNKKGKLVIEPQIDHVYMAHSPQLIKEGMLMNISDNDLDIDENILIDSISITQDSDIRKYTVVLREDKDKDLFSYFQKNSKDTRERTMDFIVNASSTKTQSTQELPIYSIQTRAAESFSPSGSFHPLGGGRIDFLAETLRMRTLVLPTLEPSDNLSSTEWAMYMSDTGFSGEEPSGGSVQYFGELEDVSFNNLLNNQAAVYDSTIGKFINKTISLDGHAHNDLYYTKSQIDDLILDDLISGGTNFHPLYGLLDGNPLNLFADKLVSNTLIIPQSLPNVSSSEWGLYMSDTGFSAEFPAELPEHNHNTLYYTKGEIDLLLGGIVTDAYTTAQIDSFFNGSQSISGYNKSNWDTAYNWGNHALQGYAVGSLSNYYTKLEIAMRYYTAQEVINIVTGFTPVYGYNIANWDEAYSWGNHAAAGYITGSHNHDGLYYSKTHIDNNFYTRNYIDNNFYTRNYIDNNFYTRNYIDNNLMIPDSPPINPVSGKWYLYMTK